MKVGASRNYHFRLFIGCLRLASQYAVVVMCRFPDDDDIVPLVRRLRGEMERFLGIVDEQPGIKDPVELP